MTRKPDHMLVVWSDGIVTSEAKPYWRAEEWVKNNCYFPKQKAVIRIRVYMKAKA